MCCNPFVLYVFILFHAHILVCFLSLCDFCFVVVVLFVQFKLDLSNKSSVIEVGPARDSGADVKRLEFITMFEGKRSKENVTGGSWTYWYMRRTVSTNSLKTPTLLYWPEHTRPVTAKHSLLSRQGGFFWLCWFHNMHLADAFIPKRLTVHSGYTFVLSVCVFPGNRTHNLLRCYAMLYHWATGTI